MADLLIRSGAVMSECGKYRYRLSRVWDEIAYVLPFVMLNPSIADAKIDDPTIRRCMGFARREGYGGIEVTNLYAFRATSPVDLWKAIDPEGPDNAQHLTDVAKAAAAYGVPIVCAWGAHGGRNNRPIAIMQAAGANLRCLGKTKGGNPRHPLYVRADQQFDPFHGP
jgi:hypothetical protein